MRHEEPVSSDYADTPARGSTPRTRRLAWHAATACSGNFIELSRLHQEWRPPEGASGILLDAHRFAHVFPRLTPVVREGELIGGGLLQADEEPGWGWTPSGDEDYVETFAKLAPPDRPEIAAMAARGLISPAASLCHKVVDYAGFIRTGSAELARQARALAEEKQGT